MRIPRLTLLLASLATLALAWKAADVSNAAYNKWHRSELERWLHDHNVPFSPQADYRELRKLIQDRWDDFTSTKVFDNWSDSRLSHFIETKTGIPSDESWTRPSLVQRLESLWTDGWTRLPAEKWGDVKSWVFDTWSDSQLRGFLEYHGVVSPKPLNGREALLAAVKEHYNQIAGHFGDDRGMAYPGDWLYGSWSDSELRDWLVEHGWIDKQDKTPQTRSSLLVSMRTNWLYDRIISNWESIKEAIPAATESVSSSAHSFKDAAESYAHDMGMEASKEARLSSSRARQQALSISSAASKAAAEASRSGAAVESQVSDSMNFDQLRSWADEHGIPLPDDIRLNELRAVARKYQDRLASATEQDGYLHAATTSAGNEFARATEAAAGYFRGAAERVKEAFGAAGHAVPDLENRVDL